MTLVVVAYNQGIIMKYTEQLTNTALLGFWVKVFET